MFLAMHSVGVWVDLYACIACRISTLMSVSSVTSLIEGCYKTHASIKLSYSVLDLLSILTAFIPFLPRSPSIRSFPSKIFEYISVKVMQVPNLSLLHNACPRNSSAGCSKYAQAGRAMHPQGSRRHVYRRATTLGVM